MALQLSDVPVAPVASAPVPPLTPVVDPSTGQPCVHTVAGIKLAVCSRDPLRVADYALCRYRPARAATADYAPAIPARDDKPAVKQVGKPAREEGWTPTAKLADIARAIGGGLIA